MLKVVKRAGIFFVNIVFQFVLIHFFYHCMKIAKYIIFLLFCYSMSLKAQENYGGKVGLNFQFGSHIQRLGLMYQLYYFNNMGQVSQGVYLHYNFRNFGPRGGYLEAKFHIGVQGHWGKSSYKKYQFNELSNYPLMITMPDILFICIWIGRI